MLNTNDATRYHLNTIPSHIYRDIIRASCRAIMKATSRVFNPPTLRFSVLILNS
jgi:hypothetical protein